MKMKSILVAAILLAFSFSTVVAQKTIHDCFISFENASQLNASSPNRLPKDQAKPRKLSTHSGSVKVSRIDGYRVVYKNENKALFVTLMVELSSAKKYDSDIKNILANLDYINSNTKGMETEEIIELEFNGYTIYGTSRGSITSGETLGIFIMFPGNDITVYFYFQNIDLEKRHFHTLEEYKTARDNFMNEYTLHLTECLAK